MVCADCALASSAAVNTPIGAAVTANPATTFRLVIDVETDWAMVVISLARATKRGKAELDDCMGTSFLTAIRPCASEFDAAERQKFLVLSDGRRAPTRGSCCTTKERAHLGQT